MGAENSGNLDAAIDSVQAQIEQQKADSTNNAEYHAAFFNQVDEFQKYNEGRPLGTAEEEKYFGQGKEQVNNLLLRVAAVGKEIVESREKLEGKDNASAPQEKEKSKKGSESHENFYSLEQELKGILNQYHQNLEAMESIELNLETGKEEDLKLHNLELTRAERLQFSIDGKDPELQKSIEKSLSYYEYAVSCMKNHPEISANYKNPRERLLQQSIKPLLQKLTQIKQQETIVQKYFLYVTTNRNKRSYSPAYYKLPKEKQKEIKDDLDGVAYRVIEDFEANTCLTPLNQFWAGKRILESGQTEQARALLTSFISNDLQKFKDYPTLKGQENKYKRMAEELLKALDKALKESGNLEKDLEKQNEKFFKGQQLLQSDQIIEAKTSFKEYLKELKGKPENAGHPDFKDSAKAYLWKIAKIQLAQAKERFTELDPDKSSDLSESIAQAAGSEHNPKAAFEEAKKHHFYAQKFQEIGKVIDEQGLDFEEACKKVLGEDIKFDPDNRYNVFAEEILVDKENPEEKKEGLLTLAKKYLGLGKTALAEQYYREYFSSQLNNLAKTTVSITSLRQKYGSPKYYPKIQPAVDQKLAQMEAAYNIRAKQDPAWAKEHPFDSMKIRGVILDEALRKIMPNEVCEEQQRLFAADKNTFSNPKDQQAWSEFANMKGIHRQGTELEMFAMSDDEVRSLINELPIDIAFMAISGGLGGIGEKVVSEAVLKHGLTEVGLELAEMGIASGERKLAAYSAGLLANNTLFTGSNVLLNAIRKGEFKNMGETFKQEWASGFAILGGLGQVGKLSHALHLGAISSTTLELVGMSMPEGQLTVHNVGVVLGLKIAHAGQKLKDASEKENLKEVESRLAKFDVDINNRFVLDAATVMDDGSIFIINNQDKLIRLPQDVASNLPPAIKKNIKSVQEKIKSWDKDGIMEKQTQTFKQAGIMPKDYDFSHDPEFVSAFVENRWEDLKTYVRKVTDRYKGAFIAKSEGPIHGKVFDLASHLDPNKTIRNNKSDYKVVGTHLNDQHLPGDWKTNDMLGYDDYLPGKSLIIELEDIGNASNKKYIVLNAKTIYEMLPYSSDIPWIGGLAKDPGAFERAIKDIKAEAEKMTDPELIRARKLYEQTGKDSYNFTHQTGEFFPQDTREILDLQSQLLKEGGPDLRLKVVNDPATGEPIYEAGKIVEYLKKLIESTKAEKLTQEARKLANTENPAVHKQMMELAEKIKINGMGKKVLVNITNQDLIKQKHFSKMESFILKKVITDAKDLPANWGENGVERNLQKFEFGKSFILELTTKDGSTVYQLVTAQEVWFHEMSEYTRYKELVGQDDVEGNALLSSITAKVTIEYGIAAKKGISSEPPKDFLQKALDLKREIKNRKDLSSPGRQLLFQRKIADLRVEVATRQKILGEKIRDYIADLATHFNTGSPNLEEFMKKVKADEALTRDFTSGEIDIIENKLREVFEKSQIISRYYEQYKDQPEKLFEVEYGKKPEGKVVIHVSPVSLTFQLYDINDYMFASQYKDMDMAKSTGGCSTPGAHIADLTGAINLVNGEQSESHLQEILTHEDRHTSNRHIFDALSKAQLSTDRVTKFNSDNSVIQFNRENTGWKIKELTVRDRIVRDFSAKLQVSTGRAKDEILAYMSDGRSFQDIAQILTREKEPGGDKGKERTEDEAQKPAKKKGLYDYWAEDYEPELNSKYLTLNASELDPASRKLVIDNMAKYKAMHKKIVIEAVKAAEKIKDINLLSAIPIKDWPKIAAETESKSKDTKDLVGTPMDAVPPHPESTSEHEGLGPLEITSQKSLTVEEIKTQFTTENLARLSLPQYIDLLKRVAPRFITHVVRQGVRDHFTHHQGGIGEFHNGFTEILKDGSLRSALDQALGGNFTPESVKKVLDDILHIKEKAKTREEAEAQIDSYLNNSTLNTVSSWFADQTAIHAAMDYVADNHYGAENGNEVFFVFPTAMMASQYDVAAQAMEFHEGLKLDSDSQTSQFNDWWFTRKSDKRGSIPVDSGIAFIPADAMVDPQTGSKYALDKEMKPIPNEGQVGAIKQVAMTLKAKGLWADLEENLYQYIDARGENQRTPSDKTRAKLSETQVTIQPLIDEARAAGITDPRFYEILDPTNENYDQLKSLMAICDTLTKSEPLDDGEKFARKETVDHQLRGMGFQYKLAENTMSSKDYWENHFAKTGKRPSKVVYYTGSPNEAFERFKSENGLNENPDHVNLKTGFAANLNDSNKTMRDNLEPERAQFKAVAGQVLDEYFPKPNPH